MVNKMALIVLKFLLKCGQKNNLTRNRAVDELTRGFSVNELTG